MINFAAILLRLMRKSTLLLLLLIISIWASAQENPQQAGDTITKKINEAKQNIENNLNNIIVPVPPVTLVQPRDSVPLFDSLHGKLTIIIKGIEKIVGNMNVALYNSYKSFANKETPFRGAVVPVSDYTLIVAFDSIPKGVYSVAVFQDEDKNGVLKTNNLGIPIEGYGFSNNVPGAMRPPDYAQTKFVYSGKNKAIIINMVYFKFPK